MTRAGSSRSATRGRVPSRLLVLLGAVSALLVAGCDRSRATAVRTCRTAIVGLLVDPSSARLEGVGARRDGPGWRISLTVTANDGRGRAQSRRVVCETGWELEVLEIHDE